MTDFNDMQTIKRRMFAMRNGALADSLRRLGAPYKIIFGVNIPQLAEIARDYVADKRLAQRLWENVSTRESMLIAPMIYPRDEMSEEDAVRWIEQVPAAEVADILCHRLLRHLSFAPDLVARFADSENDMLRYVALRLAFNLLFEPLPKILDEAHRLAEAELTRNVPLTYSLANSLLDEVELLQSGWND